MPNCESFRGGGLGEVPFSELRQQLVGSLPQRKLTGMHFCNSLTVTSVGSNCVKRRAPVPLRCATGSGSDGTARGAPLTPLPNTHPSGCALLCRRPAACHGARARHGFLTDLTDFTGGNGAWSQLVVTVKEPIFAVPSDGADVRAPEPAAAELSDNPAEYEPREHARVDCRDGYLLAYQRKLIVCDLSLTRKRLQTGVKWITRNASA